MIPSCFLGQVCKHLGDKKETSQCKVRCLKLIFRNPGILANECNTEASIVWGQCVEAICRYRQGDRPWFPPAPCNGNVAPMWVIENDMHRCSLGAVAENQYKRLPSMNLSHWAFATNFPQPDDARWKGRVSRKLYNSLSSSLENTRGKSKKRVCHLAGRLSLYECPISPGNKSPRH